MLDMIIFYLLDKIEKNSFCVTNEKCLEQILKK